MAIDIIAEPLILDMIMRGTISYSPPSCKDHRLDTEVDISELGELFIDYELLGGLTDFPQIIDPFEITYEISGKIVVGQVITAAPLNLEYLIPYLTRYSSTAIPVSAGFGGPVLNVHQSNWIKWSKIGFADFTIDHSNVSGERPMAWSGYVFHVKRLGNAVVVYGSGGISISEPKDVHWTEKVLSHYGLPCKTACAGNATVHYFVDVLYRLWTISEDGIQLLGYQEYLSTLENPVVSFDEIRNLVYISDENSGFVYSADTRSFGRAYSGITGIGFINGTMLVVSPETLVRPLVSITTDIYDFGNRHYKTINSLELGTDINTLDNILQARVLYRTRNDRGFSSTPWVRVNPSGIAFTPCYGMEFKFSIRSLEHEDLRLDYLRIVGSMSGYEHISAYRQSSEE